MKQTNPQYAKQSPLPCLAQPQIIPKSQLSGTTPLKHRLIKPNIFLPDNKTIRNCTYDQITNNISNKSI